MPEQPNNQPSMPLSSPGPMKADMPPAIRKRLIVSGQVQDVGYRTLVKQKARKKGLVGVARNLAEGTVEIICEGEPGAIDGFLKDIDVKTDNPSPLDIDVATIVESPPPPIGVYKSFEVDYGKKLSVAERSTKDREELTIFGASLITQEMRLVGKDVREVGQNVDGVGKAVEVVGQKVDSMHLDMNTRFDHMAERYDMIALSLKEAIVHMDRNAEKTDKAIEKSRKETIIAVRKSEERTARTLAKSRQDTILEVRKSEERTAKILKESRKDVADSNRELAGVVKFMIKKLSDKPARKRPPVKRKR